MRQTTVLALADTFHMNMNLSKVRALTTSRRRVSRCEYAYTDSSTRGLTIGQFWNDSDHNALFFSVTYEVSLRHRISEVRGHRKRLLTYLPPSYPRKNSSLLTRLWNNALTPEKLWGSQTTGESQWSMGHRGRASEPLRNSMQMVADVKRGLKIPIMR